MPNRVARHGLKHTIVFLVDKNGCCPGGEFFDALDLRNRIKLQALFQIAGDYANFSNSEKFGRLGDGLFEFKSFQIRMPFAHSCIERQTIVITHGFIKKKQKTPVAEIERARLLLKEYSQTKPKLTLVKKNK